MLQLNEPFKTDTAGFGLKWQAMGLEATTTASTKNEVSEGKLQWESDALLFKGSFRLKIPATSISNVLVKGEDLVVEYSGTRTSFHLGPAAAKWQQKILHPPTLFHKLGVKSNQKIALVNWKDSKFADDLRSTVADVLITKTTNCDLVFLGAEKDADLEKLNKLEPMLKRNGAIWIVYPKGQKVITEASVMAASKAANFVDNKTCRFSDTHTGLRVVIPLARR